jgi:hypothetical protein
MNTHPERQMLNERALEKLQLWFFRDMSDEQRLALFSIFGMPVDEIGKVHGLQRRALKRILRALSAIHSQGAAEPSAEAVAWQWRKTDCVMAHDVAWSYVDYHTGLKIKEHPEKYETRPLFASPAPVAVAPVGVPEWLTRTIKRVGEWLTDYDNNASHDYEEGDPSDDNLSEFDRDDIRTLLVGLSSLIPDAKPAVGALELRKIIFDALDLSAELRNECADAVAAALSGGTATPKPEGVSDIPEDIRRAATASLREVCDTLETDMQWNAVDIIARAILAERTQPTPTTAGVTEAMRLEAMTPFTTFAQETVEKTADGWVWSAGLGRDRICDWFGPSDFGLLLHFSTALSKATRLPFSHDRRAQAALLADLPESVAREAGNFYESYGTAHDSEISKSACMAEAWAGVLRPYLIGLRDHFKPQSRPEIADANGREAALHGGAENRPTPAGSSAQGPRDGEGTTAGSGASSDDAGDEHDTAADGWVATVIWHDPQLDLTLPKPGKIIDASLSFMDSAPIGTKLYTQPTTTTTAGVTEAQIERALAEWSKPNDRRDPADIMRAALSAALGPSTDVMVQCGWAYQDARWDADRWHVCGFDSRPRDHEGRLVRPIYVPLSASTAGGGK